jgi:DNA-binding NarL/FixJ family response regulator
MGVQTVRSADSSDDPRAAVQAVALVCGDDLVVRRVRDALSVGSLTLVQRAHEVESLSPQVSHACAIVLAGCRAVAERQLLIRAADARFPGVPIVVIAPRSGNGVHKSLEAGAAGFVLDTEIETALAATIQAVCTGQIVVPHLFRHTAVRPALSHREKETLALLANGLTNRQIAARLYLAESTVKTHLSSIFGKLGVTSRSEAAALVLDPDTKLGITLPGFATAGVAGSNGNHAP